MVADRQHKAQIQDMLSRGGPALAVIGIHVILIYVISASMGIVPIPSIKQHTDVVFISEERPDPPPAPIIDPIEPLAPQLVQLPAPTAPIVPQIEDPVPEAQVDQTSITAAQVAQPPAAGAGQPQELKTRQRVDPLYPAAARRDGEEGTVRLRVMVDERGRPSEVEVAKSSGFSRLDEAAIDAVRRWRFQAATNGSTAVSAWTQVAVSFKLTDKDRR